MAREITSAEPSPALDIQPLLELTQAVAAANTPEDIFGASLAALRQSLGIDRAAVLLFDPDGVLRFKAWHNLSERYRRAVEGHTPWTPDTTDAEPVLVPDVREEGSLAALRETIEREGIRALAFVPLVLGNRLLGKFMLYYRVPHDFHPQEVLVARTIAAHVAFAINQQEHRDIREELAETIERLSASNRAKDEFLGWVSHELKTPITTVLGNALVLVEKADAIGSSERQAAMADIAEGAERLHRTIEDLLMVARIEHDRVEPEPVIVRRIVARVVREHERRYPQRTITLDASGTPQTVLTSAGYLEHVIGNLLSNAEKYSTTGLPIDVTVQSDDREVIVRVLDRGPGVSEEDRERVFEAFYRAPASADEVPGIGLGLAICRRIIEAQDGRIWIAPRDGGGSEFGFALRLMDEDPEPA